MRRKAYLSHTYDTVFSRHGLTVEYYEAIDSLIRRTAIIEGRLRYWDGSLLRFREELVEEGVRLRKLEYVYHYQAQDRRLL